jgi:hypothetical protein
VTLERKIRPESVLKSLPAEKQEAVFRLIEGTTYALAMKALAETMSLQTSQPALCAFRAWYLKRKLRRDMLDSVKIADVIDKQVDEAALDRAIAIKTKDLAWRALLGNQDKDAIKALVQLSLDNRHQDREDKKLDRLMQAEKQRDDALAKIAEIEKRVALLVAQIEAKNRGAAEADPSKAMDALETFLGTKPKADPAASLSSAAKPQTAPAAVAPQGSAPPDAATEAPRPGPALEDAL